jgi:serine protease AprX
MSLLISVTSSRPRKSRLLANAVSFVPVTFIPLAVIGVLISHLRAMADPQVMTASLKKVDSNKKADSKPTVAKRRAAAVKSKKAPTVPANAFSKMDDFVLKQYMGLTAASGSDKCAVIIRLTASTITPSQKNTLAQLGGKVYRSLPLVESVAVSLPVQNLRKLGALPFVARISADTVVSKNDEFTVESSGADRAMTDFGLTGRGVGVAVLDTGISNHSDFSGNRGARIVADVNFAPNSRDRVRTNDTSDECGHGTHVAGIIAGNGEASDSRSCFRTFYGIAREASLINVRVLNEQGEANVSTVISGISWAVQNRNRYNIRVMNISFGHAVGESYETDPLCQAVEAAWKSGIVVVTAAGNSGRSYNSPAPNRDNEGYGTAYGTIQSPANSPYVITVGAMKQGSRGRNTDQIATYSSRGPTRLDLIQKPDLVAAGNAVVSTLADEDVYLVTDFYGSNRVPNSAYRSNGNNRPSRDYLRLSGTSMSAPVVSGAAALLLQKYPGLSPDSVKARLMLTATKWRAANGTQDICTYGAGYLDIPAALNSRTVATIPALSPTLTQQANGTIVMNGEQILVPMNGGLSPYGTGRVGGLQAIWGGNALLSDGRLTNDIVLSESPVWSDRQRWTILSTSVDLSSITVHGDE